MAHKQGLRFTKLQRRIQETSELQDAPTISQQPSLPLSEVSHPAPYWSHREESRVTASSMQEQLLEKDQHVARLQETLRREREKCALLQRQIAQQGAELRRREQQNNRLKERLSQLTAGHRERGAAIEILNTLPIPTGRRVNTGRTARADSRREEEALRLMLERREAELREAMKLRHGVTTLLHMLRTDMEQTLRDTDVTEEEERDNSRLVQSEQALGDHVTGGVVREWINIQRRLRGQLSQGNTTVITDQEKLLTQMEGELDQSRQLIRMQQQLLQDSITDSLPTALIDSYYLEEWERLQDKWVELEHQRRSFERERQTFTDAAIRLGRERCLFEQQKSSYLRQQFLSCSLLMETSHNRRESTALGHFAPDLLSPSNSVPVTPTSVGSGQNGVTTPDTPELYSVLRLPNDHRSVRSLFQSENWELCPERAMSPPVEHRMDWSF